MIVKRLEDACALELRAPGFPEELVDDKPRVEGHEIKWNESTA
jgi:3-hydroxyisobutyrate dehydrogenase